LIEQGVTFAKKVYHEIFLFKNKKFIITNLHQQS